jgi:hypothetical protein
VGHQQQLNALLFELQAADSPLHQARALARAWRTVRELNPTDRRLLARHVTFAGAEELLEGLAGTRGRLAPALVLEALSQLRSADADAVAEVVTGLRDSERRRDVFRQGAGTAAAVLENETVENIVATAGDELAEANDVDSALGELRAVQMQTEGVRSTGPRAPEIGNGSGEDEPVSLQPPAGAAIASADRDAVADEPEQPTVAAADEMDDVRGKAMLRTKLSRPAPPPRPEVVDWKRWDTPEMGARPDQTPTEGAEPTGEGQPPPFAARAILGALGAEHSLISQLRVLRRELSGFEGSSLDTLRQVLEVFPDGWSRRRALCAMLEAGLPADAGEAIELVALLERESDRGWCLGILARAGRLWGPHLQQALELVRSPAARRRIETAGHGTTSAS